MKLVVHLSRVIRPTRPTPLRFDRRLTHNMSPGRAVTAGNIAVLLLAFAVFVLMAS